jgi:hypothetical protein
MKNGDIAMMFITSGGDASDLRDGKDLRRLAISMKVCAEGKPLPCNVRCASHVGHQRELHSSTCRAACHATMHFAAAASKQQDVMMHACAGRDLRGA